MTDNKHSSVYIYMESTNATVFTVKLLIGLQIMKVLESVCVTVVYI